jgi:hypothetical protein
VGTRRPGRGRNMEIKEHKHFCEMYSNPKHLFKMYTNLKRDQTCVKITDFLDETGCILNEKMTPDVTVTVPDFEIGKKNWKINFSRDKDAVVSQYHIFIMTDTKYTLAYTPQCVVFEGTVRTGPPPK